MTITEPDRMIRKVCLAQGTVKVGTTALTLGRQHMSLPGGTQVPITGLPGSSTQLLRDANLRRSHTSEKGQQCYTCPLPQHAREPTALKIESTIILATNLSRILFNQIFALLCFNAEWQVTGTGR